MITLADAVSHQETYLEKIEMTQNQLYGVRTDIKMEPVYETPGRGEDGDDSELVVRSGGY